MIILRSDSTSPSFNLAAEEFLFSKTSEDFLWLYVNEPSVIVGSNQAVLNEIDPDFCIDHDIRIVRRLSGGGAVYHDTGNLNYSFIRNRMDEPLSARFLFPVVEMLHTLGIPVEIGKRKDLWLEGYKVSGTASHISKGRELHHGTLLYDADLTRLSKALNAERRDFVRKATQSVPSAVRNIRSYLNLNGRVAPEPEVFFNQFAFGMFKQLGAEKIEFLNENFRGNIEMIRRDKYIRRAWNYRM